MINSAGDSFHTYSIKKQKYLMKSSNTSSWESKASQKLSDGPEIIGEEALFKSSTRELAEFYWSNRKRFSGGYEGFPTKLN